MKKVAIFFLIILSKLAFSQSGFKCGQDVANDYLFSQDKTAKQHFEKLIEDADKLSNIRLNVNNSSSTFTIPVVFHVLHLGGNENISDAQIQDAVTILNRDFRKKNADTLSIVSQFKNLAADCDIEFRLATLDENGNCTNGITRHYTPNTNWTVNFSNYLYTWDRTKYLNIYVVKTMQNGAAGYTYLPGQVSAIADAVVILHNYTGSIGTSNNFSSRALTHEVGHWFNLQHVWGSTNQPGVACGDDGVTDTPNTKGHSSCSLNSAVCSPGVVENVQNYMEYAYCSKMFTIGQKNRMQNCINSGVAGRDNLSSATNLIATGVINPNFNCAPKAEFTSNSITCVGNNFNLTDYSYNGPVTTWLWSSPSAINTSTLQNGVLTFTNSGLASVKLKVGNAFGEDSIIKQSLIVLSGLNSGILNLIQSFETNFPDSNWLKFTPQFGCSFATYTNSSASGTNCAWVNNYYDNPTGSVSIYSPLYNFQNLINAPQLSFKYAYAQRLIADNDVFKVYISSNCGGSWTQLFSKSGSQLSTTGALVASPFLNPSQSQWATENINLSAYSGNQKVAFKFEFIPYTPSLGNNFFIDDINISGIVSVIETDSDLNGVQVYPNPVAENLIIKADDLQKIKSVMLFDILGKELAVSIEKNTNYFQLLVKTLPKGIYFLRIFSSEGSKTIKLFKE